jgi:hypothetical protein
MKKRGTPQNTKGLLEKPSDEKRGTLTKLKGAPKKDLRWKKRHPHKTQRGSLKRPLMKKEAAPQNTKGLDEKTSDEKRGTPQNAKGHVEETSDRKKASPQNTNGLIEKTFDGKGGNHSKSLVPHWKFGKQHINLKGVSSQSYWICVPMFSAAQEGTIAHSRVGHWCANFLHKKLSTKATNAITMSEAIFANQMAAGEADVFSA